MKFTLIIGACVACLCALFASVSPAQANTDQLSLGFVTGFSDFDLKSEDGSTTSDNGTAIGVVGRYTVTGNDGGFFGIHTAFVKETTSVTETDYLYGYAVEGKFEPEWSGDLMVRFGKDFGSIAPYLAAGLSIMNSTVSINYQNNEVGSDKATHTGWKLAVGTDFDISDSLAAFIQAEYADYGEETYKDQGVEIPVSAKQKSVRFGLMFNF